MTDASLMTAIWIDRDGVRRRWVDYARILCMWQLSGRMVGTNVCLGCNISPAADSNSSPGVVMMRLPASRAGC